MKKSTVLVISGLLLHGVVQAGSPPNIQLPEPARVRARHQRRTDIRSRGSKVHDAADAIGLHGITAAGASDIPGALYGSPESGRIAGRTAAEAAQNFLQAFGSVYGLSAADRTNTTSRERPGFLPAHREVIIEQSVAGRSLYGGALHLHLGPNGEFIAAVGDLYGNLRWAGNAKLSMDETLNSAGAVVARLSPPQGLGPLRGARFEQTTTTEVVYPLATDARPAFLHSGIVASNGIDVFDVVVDGISGEILEVVSRTSYSQGQVFRGADSKPQSPQPSLTPGVVPPTPNPPAYVSRTTIPFTSFLSGTTLSGNLASVREYQAWTGGLRTTTSGNAIASATSDFSFTLTIGAGLQPDIRNYAQAAGTNLFYLLNYVHDYFYALGFDEAHGNFQVSNGGLGGLGNDPVVGFVQQGSGAPGTAEYSSNNANMVTPNDGQSPMMAMFVFGGTGTAPTRSFLADSALDPDVVFHEFTHGVTGRLTPNAFAGSAQSGAINEGNSDFFALNMQVPQTAPVDGAYPVGSYSVQNFSTGIRHYPYSTNIAVNPLTYAHLATIDGVAEVHNDGEIWASAMWQLRGQLVNQLGYAEGRTRAAQLDIDALQLLPADPTFVDFRNAILTADGARYSGGDVTQIWTAFAARGLGALADGGVDSFSLHTLADTSLPSTAARVRLWESAFIAGEKVRLLVNDSNAAGSTVTLTTSSGDHESMTLGADGPVWAGSITSATAAPTMNDGTLQLTAGDTIIATTTDSNTGGAIPTLTATAAVHAPYSVTTAANAFNAALSPTLLFRGDERTFFVDLGFSFAFYGRNYSRIYVNDNGQVAFGFAPFIRQRGVARVGSPPTLAPLSVDLDCTGANGVYYYSAADRFTARWSCVEYSTGNPVNTSVSIFPTGAIQFDYGTGNVLSGLDYYTNFADLATVGLNRGTDTFSQPVNTYDGATNLGSASTVLFTPVGDQNIASCPATFTDSTLTPQVTVIRKVHFDEARLCVNALRTLAGLPRFTFSPASLTGASATAAAIMDMRNALDPALPLLGRLPASYGRNSLVPGMTILASDLQEIRNAVR